MQPQWLYQLIQTSDSKWNPQFSYPSAINWIQALSFEIVQEHGASAIEQFTACRNLFTPTITPRHKNTSLAPVFASLFHSLTFSVSLTSLVEIQTCKPWMFTSAIVTWYYGVYNAFKAILAAHDGRQTETHAAMQKALFDPDIRAKLPHPFNMIATYQSKEIYSCELPNFADAKNANLVESFAYTRAQAQGMLLSYLKGTADWELGHHKHRLQDKHKLTSFRTKDAQSLRDQHLAKNLPEVNFLHCAFRYRGKAEWH